MLHANCPRCHSLARGLLGTVVVWQVAYLFLTNFWGLFPAVPAEVLRYEMGEDRPVATPNGPRPESTVGRGPVGTAMDRWGELSGQWQGWALFAPNVPRSSSFLAVELHWHEPSSAPQDAATLAVTSTGDRPPIARTFKLLSRFEPADPAHYWIPAWRHMRLYNYEWRLAVAASVFAESPARPNSGASNPDVLNTAQSNATTPNTAAEAPTAGQTADAQSTQQMFLAELLRREWRQFEAYLRMRLADYAAEHTGDMPPDDVVLLGRTYRAAPAAQSPWHWDTPSERPLARWRPRAETNGEFLPLELYDEARGEFVQVRRDG